MKSLSKILASLTVILGISIPTFAQVTATATSSATIVTPITITKDVDMNFGNVAVQSTTGGTVVMTPSGVRTKTGGVTLPATVGTVAAASFTVTGESGYTFAITLPAGAVTISDGGSNTMTVDNWTSDPTPTGTLTGGTATLNVGATLNVSAGQPAGTYTNASDLSVTVNYN